MKKVQRNFFHNFSTLKVIALSGCFFLGFVVRKETKWGFWAHQRINRLAVYTLPPEMMGFYKVNINYLAENAVNPDQRRYALVDEAPKHYIDLDKYGDSAVHKLPRNWADAVNKYSEDTLKAHGIVPWVLPLVKAQLTAAFKNKDAGRILKLSADLGHYAGDINVPLHTTSNYNGQKTGQEGIHGFWETRIPERFATDYDFFVGKATYLPSVSKAAWQAVTLAHAAVDTVLSFEKNLTQKMGANKKYSMEDRNGSIQKTYASPFTDQYNKMLKGQVERQMRASVKLTADLWYTAWIDAGQPDLKNLGTYIPNQKEEETEKRSWLNRVFNARQEVDN